MNIFSKITNNLSAFLAFTPNQSLFTKNFKRQIKSQNAPQPTKYFSQAILSDARFKLELSGQIALDPKTMKLIGENNVSEQTKQTFKNIEAILSEIGWTLKNITKDCANITRPNFSGPNTRTK